MREFEIKSPLGLKSIYSDYTQLYMYMFFLLANLSIFVAMMKVEGTFFFLHEMKPSGSAILIGCGGG
jgi:hypothetical protein